MTAARAPMLRPPRQENDFRSLITAENILVREARLELPWKQRIGKWREKPVEKLAMAGEVRVPPAPWVKISMGCEGVSGEVRGEEGALERVQGIDFGSKGIEKLRVVMLMNPSITWSWDLCGYSLSWSPLATSLIIEAVNFKNSRTFEEVHFSYPIFVRASVVHLG